MKCNGVDFLSTHMCMLFTKCIHKNKQASPKHTKSNNAALGLRLDMHSLGEGWHYCLSVNQSKTSVNSCVQNGIDSACLSVLQWPVIQYEQHFKKDAEISFACLRGKMFAPQSLVSRHHVTGDSCPVGGNWNLYNQIVKTCLVLFESI